MKINPEVPASSRPNKITLSSKAIWDFTADLRSTVFEVSNPHELHRFVVFKVELVVKVRQSDFSHFGQISIPVMSPD